MSSKTINKKRIRLESNRTSFNEMFPMFDRLRMITGELLKGNLEFGQTIEHMKKVVMSYYSNSNLPNISFIVNNIISQFLRMFAK